MPALAFHVLPFGNNLLIGGDYAPSPGVGFNVFNATTNTIKANSTSRVLAVSNNVIYGIALTPNYLFFSPDGSVINTYTPPAVYFDNIPSIFGNMLVAVSSATAQLFDLVILETIIHS